MAPPEGDKKGVMERKKCQSKGDDGGEGCDKEEKEGEGR